MEACRPSRPGMYPAPSGRVTAPPEQGRELRGRRTPARTPFPFQHFRSVGSRNHYRTTSPGVSRTRKPPGGSPTAGTHPRPPPPRRRNASRHSPTGGRTVGLIPARPGRYPNTDRLVLCGYPPVCGGPMTEPSPVTTSALPQRNLNRDPGHLEKPDRQFRPLPIDGSRAVLGPPSARSASVRLPGSR